MSKQRATGFWSRTSQALGKFFAAVVSLPENPRQAQRAAWTDVPRFPPF